MVFKFNSPKGQALYEDKISTWLSALSCVVWVAQLVGERVGIRILGSQHGSDVTALSCEAGLFYSLIPSLQLGQG